MKVVLKKHPGEDTVGTGRIHLIAQSPVDIAALRIIGMLQNIRDVTDDDTIELNWSETDGFPILGLDYGVYTHHMQEIRNLHRKRDKIDRELKNLQRRIP